MLSVNGIYEDGKITLLEQIPYQGTCKVIVTVLDDNTTTSTKADSPQKHRTFGEYEGQMSMADDFDDPLPDDFWMGKEA